MESQTKYIGAWLKTIFLSRESYESRCSNFNTREFDSREILQCCKPCFDIFGVSCGAFWTKIGGNQAETIPNLPIYPRALDLCKKTKQIAKEKARKIYKNNSKKKIVITVIFSGKNIFFNYNYIKFFIGWRRGLWYIIKLCQKCRACNYWKIFEIKSSNCSIWRFFKWSFASND